MKLLLLLLAILLFGIGLTLIVWHTFILLEYQEVPYDFAVERGVAGLNADGDALHFGSIPPGGAGKRSMTVTPSRDARLVVKPSGDASSFVIPDWNDRVVTAGEPVRLDFTVEVPGDAEEGRFEGVVKFYFYRR